MDYTLVKNKRSNSFPSITQYFPNLEAWSVGFDREWRLLEEMQNTLMGGTSSYPPYNIKQLSEDSYKIEIAVAGFEKSELRVELHSNQLTIEGSKQSNDESDDFNYVYRGIAGRQFCQKFCFYQNRKIFLKYIKKIKIFI
jgi:molecular chaperone IbpA